MIKVILLNFIFCLISLTTLGQKIYEKDTRFVEYLNQNNVKMRTDNVEFEDAKFILRIPIGLKKVTSEMSGAFLHILDFEDDSKILLLYEPGINDSTKHNHGRLSYKEFKDLCRQISIDDFLNEIHFDSKRYFGLNKLPVKNFYAIYVNVRRKNVPNFEYSINSIELQ